MRLLLSILALGLWGSILLDAQAPSAPAPGDAGETLTLTLQNVLERARANSQLLISSQIAADLAHEDRVQARAALLPTVNWFNEFAYTQPNGTPSGVFVPNDGPHIYANQAMVHGDVFAPSKRYDWQRMIAAESVARAKAEVASRGLIAVVVQNYYAVIAAQHKSENAKSSLQEAQRFLDITTKQEQGGEVAHADSVKAEIQVQQRQRDLEDGDLAVAKAKIAIAVLIFPDFRQNFTLADDLATAAVLPPFPDVQALAVKSNPDIRAAEATVRQETLGISSAKAAMLPSLSVDYFFGINANQYALHNPDGDRLLGSALQAQLTLPVWNWGAARSRIRQAELKVRQAQTDLSLTQRQLLANLNSFYREADAAAFQKQSLRRSMDLSSESLRLTLLRYQAGEALALEVADAQSTLAQARNAYDDGLVRYRLAVANLQTLTGAF